MGTSFRSAFLIRHPTPSARLTTSPFDYTEAAVVAMHAKRGTRARPNERRDRFKTETRAAFDEALRANATLRHRMDAAERLYAAYVETSPVAVDDPES